MSESIVKLCYTFRCLRCGDDWTEEKEVVDGLEYSAPPVSGSCSSCEGDLAGEPQAWSRKFEVTEVRTFD